MSIWLIASLLVAIQIQMPGADSLSTVYHRNSLGRKLFGGYRIVPKKCVGTQEKSRSTPKTGICMFNYECNQRGGEMVGSCVDGFLFGACCSLPQPAIDLLLENEYVLPSGSYSNKLHSSSTGPVPMYDDAQNAVHSSTAADSGVNHAERDKTKVPVLTNVFTVSEDPDELFGSLLSENTPQFAEPAQQAKPILQQYLGNQNQGGFVDGQGFLPVHKYPVADTILLNHDGSMIVDEADPELIFTRFPNNKIDGIAQTYQTTMENHEKHPESFGYLTSSYMQGTFSPSKPNVPVFGAGGNYNSIHSVAAAQQVTMSPRPVTVKSSATTEFQKTTEMRDPMKNSEKYPVTPPSSVAHATSDNLILVHTLSNLHDDAKPNQSTSKSSVKYSYSTEKLPKPTVSSLEIDSHYPGYDYESFVGLSKPPIIITNPVGFDGSGQAISHILGILNNTHEKPDPVAIDQMTESGPDDGGLSTWVSVSSDKNKIDSSKSKYSTSSTKLPGTTTNYVHGPSFTVEEHESKPVPTVIVISPPSTDTSPTLLHLKPFKKPVTSSLAYATKAPIRITTRPSAATHKYPPTVQILSTGEESLINFPPVRNPDLNASGLNQVEKPTIVQSGGYPLPEGVISSIEILSDNVDLNTVDPDEDYSDFTTPAMEDEKVDVKIHSFVEKIVNSLAGNFQDLEGVLFRNENKTKLTSQNGIELNNVQVGILESVGPPPTTKKPLRKPTQKPHPIESDSVAGSEARPKPSAKPQETLITTVHPIITSKKPPVNIGTTKLTTTVKPTKRPTASATTKKPSAAISSTKKPSSATTTGGSTITRRPTTKRPKPVSSTTTTTTTTTTTEEPTQEEEIEQTTAEITDSVEHSTVDFRRECGVRPLVKKGGRIVGGKGSQFGHYPWQVLVRESTWLGLFTKNKCGGVLITHKYVITAAHCQPGFLASLVAVFGEYDISGDLESKRPVTKNIRRVIVHRQYDPATFENDLALLELDSPISYDEHIVPICMPRDGEDYTGRMATVTGWGRLKYGGGVPSVLQEVRVPLIDNSVCQEMFHTAGHQKRIISSFLCAGYANGQKDSCEGDSGGPLMVEREDGHWVLLGTVSHGIKCAAPYLPGVYMRTTYYKPWLKSITGVST